MIQFQAFFHDFMEKNEKKNSEVFKNSEFFFSEFFSEFFFCFYYFLFIFIVFCLYKVIASDEYQVFLVIHT